MNGFFLALLIVSAALGVVGSLYPNRDANGRVSRSAYGIAGMLVCCALLGGFRYGKYRRMVAETNARLEKELAAFVKVRPVRVRAAESLDIDLTYSIPCSGFSDESRREICGRDGVFLDAALPTKARDELRKLFIGPVDVGLTPSSRSMRDGDAPQFRYNVGPPEAVELETETGKSRLVVSFRRAKALPVTQATQAPFIDAAFAAVRVRLGARGCDSGTCTVIRIMIEAEGRSFCADRLASYPRGAAVGRIRACGS